MEGGGVGGGGAGVEQGWRTSDSTRTSTMWPAFKSRRGRHTWVEFAVCSLVGSKRIFPRDTFLPLSSKLSSNMHSTSKVRMGLKFPGIFSPTRQNLKEFQRNPFSRKFWKSGNKIEWNGNFQEENFKNLGQPREVFVLLRKLWKTWKILFY